jgi:hypothetical protein
MESSESNPAAYADQLKLECGSYVFTLRQQQRHYEEKRYNDILMVLQRHDIALQEPTPVQDKDKKYKINMSLCSALSELVRKTDINLEELVKLYRGETDEDSRPNKDLHHLPEGSHELASRWNDVVSFGTELKLAREPPVTIHLPHST